MRLLETTSLLGDPPDLLPGVSLAPHEADRLLRLRGALRMALTTVQVAEVGEEREIRGLPARARDPHGPADGGWLEADVRTARGRDLDVGSRFRDRGSWHAARGDGGGGAAGAGRRRAGLGEVSRRLRWPRFAGGTWNGVLPAPPCYGVYMSTTITIRTDPELREALRRRAEEEGVTLSEFLRAVLEREVVRGPLGDRVGHLRGRLRLTAPGQEKWRAELRERNWRS